MKEMKFIMTFTKSVLHICWTFQTKLVKRFNFLDEWHSQKIRENLYSDNFIESYTGKNSGKIVKQLKLQTTNEIEMFVNVFMLL